MLIYNKNNKVYGTLGNRPSSADEELYYRDEDGNEIALNPHDSYYINAQGKIARRSDNKVLNVCIEDFQVIPKDKDIPTVPGMIKHSDYLYEIIIDDIDYAYADWYFDISPAVSTHPGACTSVWKDSILRRNFDWYFNYDVAFVVRVPAKNDDDRFVHNKRFASISVADSVPGLDVDYVKSKQYINNYRFIPFRAVDGMNENGVGVSMNVVPRQHGDNLHTIPSVEVRKEVQGSAMMRFILDNFESAAEAVDYIKKYVSIFPNEALKAQNFDLHYLITDEDDAYIIELIDNKAVSKKVTSSSIKPIITNFHVLKNDSGDTIDLDSNGHVYTPATVAENKKPTAQGITTHGSGLERYNLVVDNYNDLSDFRNIVLYNKAYIKTTDPAWYSEFVGNYSDTFELTVDSLPEIFDEYVMPTVYQMYANRSRDAADTWHTTHTTYYNLHTKEMTVFDSSESGKARTFTL